MADKVYRTDYFVYKGTMYGVGTKVLLSESVHHQHYHTTEAKAHLYTFITASSDGYNAFCWEEGTNNSGIFKSRIQLHNLDDDIVKIVYPVYAELVPWHKVAIDNMKSKRVQPDVFGGWLLYIIVMGVALIFKDAFAIWTFVTIIFIIWLLNQYRT